GLFEYWRGRRIRSGMLPDPGHTSPGTVTRLLGEFEAGNRTALEELFPVVYDELRLLAHQHRRGWSGDSTLGTTALVHEAYLKLVDADRIGARSRGHFLRIAAMAMRQILCNHARAERTAKRGGDAVKVSLDVLGENATPVVFSSEHSEILAALDDSLDRLEQVDSRLSDVVECRFFGGLTVEDTAAALGTSAATVKRDWALARAWLFRDIKAGIRG
ncbi:MAG TPA: sigma-70 family RNA polymerase sigma factor, partial [Gemmatimonadaceae bacterium]|nr:sigma-70 family RNA polymerase sigma factor [Gemmatimonadaceae bacterium]